MTHTGMSKSSEPLKGQSLALPVVNALEIAASRCDGRAMGTLDILLGALSVDDSGMWEPVQLSATFVGADDLTRFEDPAAGTRGAWGDTPLTETATLALGKAVRIAAEYELQPLPPGALALGLLSDPSSAASRALLEESAVSHVGLIDLIQDELLGARLDDLDLSEGPISKPGRTARIAELLQGAASKSALSADARWPGSGSALIERVLKRAQAIEASVDPSSFALLLASLEASQDPDLTDLLASMLLNPTELGEMWASLEALEDVPATDVIQRAIERYGDDLDSAALIVSVTLPPTPRVNAALAARALTPAEVAAQLSEWRLRRDSEPAVGARVFTMSIFTMLTSLATSILLVVSIAESDGWWNWWKLVLLLLAWWGYPKEGPAAGVAIAVVLAVLTKPIVGVAQAVGILAELGLARAERDARWARTGVRLSLREQRHVTARGLNSMGRRVRMFRQAIRLALRRQAKS
jgi:hypothetical protein